MSINLGLVSESEYNCIVGFSGKIINKKISNIELKQDLKFYSYMVIWILLSHPITYLNQKIFF